nr:alpha/beta hydrolase [Salinispora arenicola]
MRSPSAAGWVRRALPTRRRALAAAAAVVLVAAGVAWAVRPTEPDLRTEAELVTVRSGPAGDEPVDLDTTLYLPAEARADAPVPAVLFAHGFGGTKESVRADAEEFAGQGYAVLTWSARGFGRSSGQIHLDHPDYEVRDAQRLLDWLAARPEVATDAPGDPRVGVVGGSYGGALALLLAAKDQRVDAIVPMITWNDLARSFLPESSGKGPGQGVFKQGWAGLFFGSGGAAGAARSADPPARSAAPPRPVPAQRTDLPRPVRSTRPAVGSPPTCAPRTYASPPPGGPTRAPSICCVAPARPAYSTRSRPRPCWCRARRTPCSR